MKSKKHEPMIEIGERTPEGIMQVSADSALLGHIVTLHSKCWLAIPDHHRNLPFSVHGLRRLAVESLKR